MALQPERSGRGWVSAEWRGDKVQPAQFAYRPPCIPGLTPMDRSPNAFRWSFGVLIDRRLSRELLRSWGYSRLLIKRNFDELSHLNYPISEIFRHGSSGGGGLSGAHRILSHN